MNASSNSSRKAIVFDLDGTLIDSAPDLRYAINELLYLASRPALSLEQVKRFTGNGVLALTKRAFEATGPKPMESDDEELEFGFNFFYKGHEAVLSEPYPDAIDTLKGLKAAGYKLAVCTNKPQVSAENVLQQMGFGDLLDAVVGGDTSSGRLKPNPQHLQAVLEALGVSADDAVLVGDGVPDVAVARACGVPVIAVESGYSDTPAGELGADLVIGCLAELPAALTKLS